MPSPAFHQQRRAAFLRSLDGPVLLFAGGQRSRNYPANYLPFRADSNFLYFFDSPEPDAAAFFDPADGTVRLFLHERTTADALWHGATPPFETEKTRHRVDEVLAVERLEDEVRRLAKGRSVRSLAVADHRTTLRARSVTGEALDFDAADGPGDARVCDAIFALRKLKQSEELEQVRRAAAITREAHLAAMRHTRAGSSEQELVGVVEGTFAHHGSVPAYGTILSVRGEVLHNNHHGNPLRDGDLVLLDAGAEVASGYCADVTRVWPVSGKFTAEQGEVYDIVLRAELAAIAAVKPGVRYRDVHLTSARVVADGLVQMGLLRGRPDTLAESGAHAVFFPHGVGHQLGLDVHDMESFGDRVHYPGGRKRSEQFGTGYLRMDRDLEVGLLFTIEPGIYFVPAILTDATLRERFHDSVDWQRAERFVAANAGRGFGGIRIEDDVLCTTSGAEVLTAAIPKDRAAVEKAVGAAR
ncbi:MAG: aminopeptidase P family protein [Planctomycetes bacterium]|nr:aminopeptidase P family protein [Planctomycetota bacterium]